LCCHSLLQEAILIKLEKDVLSDICLKLGGCAAKNIKTDIEPVVYCGVNDVIFVTELLQGAFLYKGSCL